jgi:hypothetical protein
LHPLFKKGKTCRQKELTHSEETIGHFMEEYYLPLLEKYRVHQPHTRTSSKHMALELEDMLHSGNCCMLYS